MYGHMHIQDQTASVKIGPLVCEKLKLLPTFANDCKSRLAMGQPYGYYIAGTDDNLHISKCTKNSQKELPIKRDPFEITFEVHNGIQGLTNSDTRKITIDQRKGLGGGIFNSTRQLTSNFRIPDGIYEVSGMNFQSEFPRYLTLNLKNYTVPIPIPNQSVKLVSRLLSDLDFKISISTPDKLCTDSEDSSRTFTFEDKFYRSYYRYDTKRVTYYDYKPTCTKPSINIPCSSQNPCIIQMRGYF